MKFLIDECLSPQLARIAREQGFFESQAVTWIGLQSSADSRIVRRAVEENYVLVTHNTPDFKRIIRHEEIHAGLVCLNVTHRLMNRDVQLKLFKKALDELDENEPVNQVIEVSLNDEREVHIVRYPWPDD